MLEVPDLSLCGMLSRDFEMDQILVTSFEPLQPVIPVIDSYALSSLQNNKQLSHFLSSKVTLSLACVLKSKRVLNNTPLVPKPDQSPLKSFFFFFWLNVAIQSPVVWLGFHPSLGTHVMSVVTRINKLPSLKKGL